MPRLRPSPRAGCWRWCGLRWGRGSRSERLGPRRHRGCLGHAAGTGAEHGRAKAATMPCLRFLQPRWRPRRTGAAPGPGRSPRALAAFLGAVEGCLSSTGGSKKRDGRDGKRQGFPGHCPGTSRPSVVVPDQQNLFDWGADCRENVYRFARIVILKIPLFPEKNCNRLRWFAIAVPRGRIAIFFGKFGLRQ